MPPTNANANAELIGTFLEVLCYGKPCFQRDRRYWERNLRTLKACIASCSVYASGSCEPSISKAGHRSFYFPPPFLSSYSSPSYVSSPSDLVVHLTATIALHHGRHAGRASLHLSHGRTQLRRSLLYCRQTRPGHHQERLLYRGDCCFRCFNRKLFASTASCSPH